MRTLLIILVLSLLGCATTIPLEENEIRRGIVGYWSHTSDDGLNVAHQSFELESGGTGVFRFSIGTFGDKDVGVWRLQDSVLHIMVNERGGDLLSWVAMDETYEILSLSSKTMKLKKQSSGDIYVFKRKRL